MVVACPSCATRYDMPPSRTTPNGALFRCSSCGHSWIEARAIDVIDVAAQPATGPALPRFGFEPDREVDRLVDAARTAAAEFALKKSQRRRRTVSWGILAAAVVAPLSAAAAYPEAVVRQAPAAARVYQALGMPVNIYGLDIRQVEQQNMLLENGKVLAIKGIIANVASADKKVPALRFALLDQAGKEVYAWTVDSPTRPLRSGEATNFVTRVSEPPEAAHNLQIRFARRDEIGSTAGP
jgi:predicted Zn finger-like uncharacterized protein